MKPLKNNTETTCRLSHIRRKLRKPIANMQQKKKHILAIKTKILTIKPTVIKVTLEKKTTDSGRTKPKIADSL